MRYEPPFEPLLNALALELTLLRALDPGVGSKGHLVRPALASEYRMSDDHGLLGFSSRGPFVGFSLFARPGAFRRYICGSPPLNMCTYAVFKLEEQYAAEHDDLDATVFFACGEDELTEDRMAASGIVSSIARMVETLSFRGYPSLRLSARIFPGESHTTMLQPQIRSGVTSDWGNELAPQA